MDRVRVSRAAIRLEDKGLIERVPMPDDKRAHSMRLSTGGNALYRQIVPLAYRIQGELTRDVSDAELAAFDATLDRLLACIDRVAPLPDDGG
jgi:DNA-binding MarR family transcriptional regulator